MSVGGTLYLNGRINSTENRDVVMYFPPSKALAAISPAMSNGRHFIEFDSKLYFSAFQSESQSGSGVKRRTALWSISPSNVSQPPADLVYAVDSIRSVTEDDGSLYVRADYDCNPKYAGCWQSIQTILRSNGSASGTTDLRGDDPCQPVCSGGGGGGGGGGGFGPDRPSRGQLFGVLFIALTPMVVVAAYVLYKKQMPGTFFNLYYGFTGMATVLYLLIDLDANNLNTFLKWFITIKTSLWWVVLVGFAAKRRDWPEWKEELLTWAVTLNGISFFAIMHVDLEIPFNQEAWRWVVYFLVTVIQIMLSALTSRTLPLIAGALGLFILAWKIAFELVNVANFGNGEFSLLATLAIVALQGIGIIVGAIAYAGNRDKIENYLRALLRLDREEIRKLTASEGV